jgi:uncharacterized protein YaaR (DUF327 family)
LKKLKKTPNDKGAASVSSNLKVKKSSGMGQASRTTVKTQTPAIGRITFQEVLAGENDDERRRQLLQELLDQVDRTGRELVENRTVESLFAYKNLVKSFIEEAVDFGLKVAEKRGYGRAGRTKVLRTVENIDEKLLQLTDLVLQKESKHINILSKVGELKGLMISLYL